MTTNESVYLGAYWGARRLTAGEYLRACHEFLAALDHLDPKVFGAFVVAVNREAAPAPKAYAGFETTVAQALADPEVAYVNPGGSGKDFTLAATLPQGFTLTFSDPDEQATAETAVNVSITAGADDRFAPPNSVLISLPAGKAAEYRGGARGLALVQLVADYWRPQSAVISSRELRRELKSAPLTVGPAMYFADARAAEVCGNSASAEPGPHGGVLLRLNADAPWLASADVFRRCHAALAQADMLKLKK
ncbi:MAG: hypothetical protein IT162_18080 [Bryobacterales bacterium]|nr:hypothetical protein [Bryobacterales bacterium]